MNRLIPRNRRVFAWLLTLAFVWMMAAPGAAWQCPDGTPCPSDCPMLHARLKQFASCTVDSGKHCGFCPEPVVLAPQGERMLPCTSPDCVLRLSERPETALQDRFAFTLPSLALPPPLPALLEPAAVVPVAFSFPALVFYPQCFLRPHFGRAPPACL
jgi:hypothetical protein